jgi:hypothetical protein
MSFRYEETEGCLGDDPRDAALFRAEPYCYEDDLRPTRADTDADEREILRFARYDDGRGL